MKDRASHLLVYPPLVASLDLLLIHASLLVVMLWKHELRGASLGACIHVVPYLSVGSLIIFSVFELHTNWIRRSYDAVAYSVFICVVMIALFTKGLLLWERQFVLAWRAVAIAAGIQCLLLMAFRNLLQRWYLAGRGRRRVLLVAPDEPSATKLIAKLQETAPEWLIISGYLTSHELSTLEERADECDSVMIAPNLMEGPDVIRRCARLHKQTIVVPTVLELSLFSARPMEIDDVLMFRIGAPRLSPGQHAVKRLFDLVGSTIILVCASPLIIAAAVATKVTSKGPVIFKQDRVGKDGFEYTIYKFRTMVANAETLTGPVLASESDPRITPLGRWLRATRIDELPQLFNVLKGDMSLVGPRPERQFFVDQFRETIPGYDLRFGVKPGITGLAQVAGGYSTTVERKLRFDLLYVYGYSLLFDIQILLRTVLVCLHMERAEGLKLPVESGTVTRKQSQSVGAD